MTRGKGLSHRTFLFISTLFLIAIGVVGLFWWMQAPLVETDLFIPIKSDTINHTIQVISPRPAGLDVRVKGPGADITALPQHSLQYLLQIYPAGGEVQTVHVEKDRIELPVGISIVKIQPQMITARIEQRIEKRLPIEVVLMGTPATGFIVDNTIVKPNGLSVVGPNSILIELARIPIKPLDITGMSEDFKKQVVLNLPDEIEPVESHPIFIEVIFKKKTTVKTLRGVKIKGAGADKPYRITPSTIDLTIEGPDQMMDKLTVDPQFNVYVDLAGLDSGVFVRRAVITLPLNMTLIKATPEIFSVHIGSAAKLGG